MTKTHFIAIAGMFLDQRDEIAIAGAGLNSEAMETLRSTAIRQAAYFASINERFDPKLFLTACGF